MSAFPLKAGPVLALVLLAGCSSTPVRQGSTGVDPDQARSLQQARLARLEAIPGWSMRGRVALRVGEQGGSGRLDWQQQDSAFRVSLSAPVTGQGWRLAGEPGGATLEGLEGGTRSGSDAALLLEQATGWPIPVESMAWWMRGLASPDGVLEFGADGRPWRQTAGDWTVEYQDWLPAIGRWPEMPRRLQAERDGARVRLVVDGWDALP